MAQEQAAAAGLPKAAAFEDVNDAPKDVIDPGFGFNRFVSDSSTVASINGTGAWSRMITSNSGVDWQEGFPLDRGSDEHPCVSDEHPCTREFDEAYPHLEMTDQEALVRAYALVETLQRSIREHSRFEVTLEVAVEFDQAWKADLNDGLRPLRRASPLLAMTLADAVPRQYMTQDGDLVYLKADHLAKISEALHMALESSAD